MFQPDVDLESVATVIAVRNIFWTEAGYHNIFWLIIVFCTYFGYIVGFRQLARYALNRTRQPPVHKQTPRPAVELSSIQGEPFDMASNEGSGMLAHYALGIYQLLTLS